MRLFWLFCLSCSVAMVGACGDDADTGDGSGTTDGADTYIRATMNHHDGSTVAFDEAAVIEVIPSSFVGEVWTCGANRTDRYGLHVVWASETVTGPTRIDDLNIADGNYLMVAYPRAEGGVRVSSRTGTYIEFTSYDPSPGGVIAGSFGAFDVTLEPDDIDDIVETVSAGTFRCRRALER